MPGCLRARKTAGWRPLLLHVTSADGAFHEEHLELLPSEVAEFRRVVGEGDGTEEEGA